MSRKTSLLRSLVDAYGRDVAAALMPLSFKLPDELDAWAEWVRRHPQQVVVTIMIRELRRGGACGGGKLPLQRKQPRTYPT